jgi:hypothetical protein
VPIYALNRRLDELGRDNLAAAHQLRKTEGVVVRVFRKHDCLLTRPGPSAPRHLPAIPIHCQEPPEPYDFS